MVRRIVPIVILALAFAAPALAGDGVPLEELVEGAKLEMAGGKFEQAVTHFSEALDRAPGDAEIERLLGQARSKGAASYVNTGKQLLLERRYIEAKVAFDNALDLAPADKLAAKGKLAAEKWPKAEAYCKSAKQYLDKGELDYAIAYYQKAYDLTSDASIAKWLSAAKAARAKSP